MHIIYTHSSHTSHGNSLGNNDYFFLRNSETDNKKLYIYIDTDLILMEEVLKFSKNIW